MTGFEAPADTSNFITTTKGQQWFAVEMWWNTEEDFLKPGEGFWEPYQTGFGRYNDEADAIVEAKQWAIDCEQRYVETRNSGD